MAPSSLLLRSVTGWRLKNTVDHSDKLSMIRVLLVFYHMSENALILFVLQNMCINKMFVFSHVQTSKLYAINPNSAALLNVA